MTVIDKLVCKTLTLANSAGDEVVDITLSPNNESPQRVGRLRYEFHGSYPSEIEIETGPDVVAKGIISQIMQWGPRTRDGTGRARVTMGIYADGEGGMACVIDSSTNDPSGSDGQGRSVPLVLNVGEANGTYVVLLADGRIKIQDRANGDFFEGTVSELNEAIRKAQR